MSNLIIELPIDEFYNPTPNEINTFNTLIPDKEKMSYTEHIILSSITSFLIIIVFYIIIYYQKHTINTTTLIITYLLIVLILCTLNILSKHILQLFSSIL
jgi:hypothetical protein